MRLVRLLIVGLVGVSSSRGGTASVAPGLATQTRITRFPQPASLIRERVISSSSGQAVAGAPQKTETSTIRGRVIASDTGRGVKNAEVSLAGVESNIGSRTTISRDDGSYELTGIPPSRYTLRVVRPGYASVW
jgi:hypothetical protein